MPIKKENYLIIVPIMCKERVFVPKSEKDIKLAAFEKTSDGNIELIDKESIKPINYNDDIEKIKKEIESFYIKDGYIISEAPTDNSLLRVDVPLIAQMEITVEAFDKEEAGALAYKIALEKNLELINEELVQTTFYEDALEDYLGVFANGYTILNYEEEFGVE